MCTTWGYANNPLRRYVTNQSLAPRNQAPPHLCHPEERRVHFPATNISPSKKRSPSLIISKSIFDLFNVPVSSSGIDVSEIDPSFLRVTKGFETLIPASDTKNNPISLKKLRTINKKKLFYSKNHLLFFKIQYTIEQIALFTTDSMNATIQIHFLGDPISINRVSLCLAHQTRDGSEATPPFSPTENIFRPPPTLAFITIDWLTFFTLLSPPNFRPILPTDPRIRSRQRTDRPG